MTSVDMPLSGRDPVDSAARQDLCDLFELESLHRRGAGSIVYLARDLEYGQRVAVKVMTRGSTDGPAAEEAFHKAAAATAVLDHPHIVQLYSAGATDRLFWWSMRYVEGPSLAERLRSSGAMEWATCLRLVDDVAAALESAHRLGVVHGNVTPANVLVDAAGDAHVTDFWVPWVIRHAQAPARAHPGPEADQAALAALVEACLGKPESELPAHVGRAIARATSTSPAERFPSVLGFRGALDRTTPRPGQGAVPLLGYEAIGDAPTQAARGRWVSIAALTLLAVGAVAYPWLMRSRAGRAGTVAGDDALMGRPATPPPPPAFDSMAAPPRFNPSAAAPAPAPAASVPVLPARPPVRASVRSAAPPRPSRAVEPGRLFINATPWGQVYLDDQLLGNTPQVGTAVTPGAHRLRVVRDGFEPYELAINVAAGQQLRLTDIVLHEAKP